MLGIRSFPFGIGLFSDAKMLVLGREGESCDLFYFKGFERMYPTFLMINIALTMSSPNASGYIDKKSFHQRQFIISWGCRHGTL